MIYQNSLVLMQRIQQSAVHGYHHFVAGEVEVNKFPALVSKFKFNYGIDMSRQSKFRRRRTGEAIAVLHSINIRQKNWFVLMATSGVGRIHERERLFDLRQKETRIRTPNGSHQLVHDGVSWSWAMTQDHYRKFKERIHEIASLPPHRRRVALIDDHLSDAAIEKILNQLYAEPGFRLVRRQVGELVTYLKKEWRRLRPENGPNPQSRSFLPYVRFMPNHPKSKKTDLLDRLPPMPAEVAVDWRQRLGIDLSKFVDQDEEERSKGI